jgi:hypothetical protein
MRKFLPIALVFALSCGGSGFNTGKGVNVSASISTRVVNTSVSNYTNEESSLSVSVSSDDIVRRSVYFKQARLVYKDLSGAVQRTSVFPLEFSLKSGESKSVNITLFSVADGLSVPYIYLNPVNPTTFRANYREQTLARPVSLVLGQGECHMVGSVEVCRTDFSGTFPEDITPGTCKVTAGSQVVEEKTFGLLEGDGSGVVLGNTIHVSFSKGPSTGTYVVAKCLSAIQPIEHDYISLQFAYGDVIYSVNNYGLIKDPKGNVVGEVSPDRRVKFYIALTYKDFPLIAFYYYGPILGGELIGYGNGGSTYRLKLRYSPVDPDSVKVLADDGMGFTVSCIVQSVNSSSGEVTFTCPRVIPSGVPIYAQYRLTEIFQKIDVWVDTDVGSVLAGTVNLRVRP